MIHRIAASFALMLPLAACQQQPETAPATQVETTADAPAVQEDAPAPAVQLLSGDVAERAVECATAEMRLRERDGRIPLNSFGVALQHYILGYAGGAKALSIDDSIAELANQTPRAARAIASDPQAWVASCRARYPATVPGQGRLEIVKPLDQEILCATLPRFIAVGADASEILAEEDMPRLQELRAKSDRASNGLSDTRLAEAGITSGSAFTARREQLWIAAANRANLMDQIARCPA